MDSTDKFCQIGMLDTCNLSMPFTDSCKVNMSKLIERKHTYDSDGILVSTTGKLKNLNIRVYNNGITVCGSLAKYYYNRNDKLLDRENLKKAIAELSEILGLNFLRAKVKRLDFAGDIEILNAVKSYFPFLANKPQMRRNIVAAGTLHYSNTNRSIIFYDKTKEFNRRKDLSNRLKVSVMRIEIRYHLDFINSITNKTFGASYLTLDMLFEKEVYAFFIHQWQKEFFSINKESALLFNLNGKSKPRQIIDAITIQGINSLGGLNETLNIIDSSRNNLNNITPELIPRAKQYVKKLIKRDLVMVPNNLMLELDDKVKEHTNKCLSWNSNIL